MIAWLQPRHWERRYGNFLKKTNAELRREFLARLGHIIKLQTLASYQESLVDDTQLIINQNKIQEETNNLLLWWSGRKPEVLYTIAGYFSVVNIYNDKQFRAVVRSATGLSIPPTQSVGYEVGSLYSSPTDILNKFGEAADVYRTEPFLNGLSENWKAVQETYIDKTVQQTISEAVLTVRNGLVTSAVAKTILNAVNTKFESVDKRVNSFGSQQIDKLDNQLTSKRQQSLGLNQYVWDTRKDERVRGDPTGLYPNSKPSHYARQNDIYSWNNPPEGGHPGEAEGCRCRPLIRLPR